MYMTNWCEFSYNLVQIYLMPFAKILAYNNEKKLGKVNDLQKCLRHGQVAWW